MIHSLSPSSSRIFAIFAVKKSVKGHRVNECSDTLTGRTYQACAVTSS